MKYFGLIADNGARGLECWKESAERHNVEITSYLEDIDGVVLKGSIEDLERFAGYEMYSWEVEEVKDYCFETEEEAKHEVEQFIISKLDWEYDLLWQ